MTRINIGINPSTLCRQHLLAEHREIKRIPNAVRSGKAKIVQTEKFSLGKGHVKFFYTRLGYLLDRYKQVHAECVRRGYNVTDYSDAWDGVPSNLMGDYTPTPEDISVVQERINQRLENMQCQVVFSPD
jgi:hypothetical protein